MKKLLILNFAAFLMASGGVSACQYEYDCATGETCCNGKCTWENCPDLKSKEKGKTSSDSSDKMNNMNGMDHMNKMSDMRDMRTKDESH